MVVELAEIPDCGVEAMPKRTMQALVKTAHGPGNLELRQVPVPLGAPDQVVIRVRACGMCGSDLNVVVTPHLGWYTDGAVKRIVQITLNNIAAFMRGEEINRLV